MKKLSDFIQLKEDKLLQLTFYYVLHKFSITDSFENSRCLSGMIREELYYCPICINDDPYYKLIWKIKGVECCVTHGVYLLKKCHFCNHEIKYKDVDYIDRCPYCEKKLGKTKDIIEADNGVLQKGKWLDETWRFLFSPMYDIKMPPAEVALKLLYILNARKEVFDRKCVEVNMQDPSVLPTLLQHARDTLSQKRVLHLSFILQVLFDHTITIVDFLQTEIPEAFYESIYKKKITKVEKASCMAPWCSEFQKNGSLVKTGTSFKQKQDSKKLYYYLVCHSCGCSYAFDQDNKLQERTYFIKGYSALNNIRRSVPTIANLCDEVGLTREQVYRCLAYFFSRGLFQDLSYKYFSNFNYTIEDKLVEKITHAIRKKIKIKEIKKWNCWDSVFHYLIYRYHQRTIETIYKKAPKSKVVVDRKNKSKNIRMALEELYKNDEDVSIKNVCKKLGVCPETIRNWGGNRIIAKVKKRQKEKRLVEMKNRIYKDVENYFRENETERVYSDDLYKKLGINRTALVSIAPEITAYIKEKRIEHNSRMNEKVIF